MNIYLIISLWVVCWALTMFWLERYMNAGLKWFAPVVLLAVWPIQLVLMVIIVLIDRFSREEEIL